MAAYKIQQKQSDGTMLDLDITATEADELTSGNFRILDTPIRNFTTLQWNINGAVGQNVNWANVSNRADFKIGDYGILKGTNSDTGEQVTLLGSVIDNSSILRMTTIACFQSNSGAYRGTYNSTARYYKGNIVAYGDAYWIALSTNFVGQTPSSSSSYWGSKVDYAKSAGTAATATKATQDQNGQNIAAYYINSGSTEQNKLGSLSVGRYVSNWDNSGEDENYAHTAKMNFQRKNAGIFGAKIFSGDGDMIFGAHLRPTEFDVKCSYDGSANSTYDENLGYVPSASYSLRKLFTWNLSWGQFFIPKSVSKDEPFILEIIKKTGHFGYTDVAQLYLLGWNANSPAYSGYLNGYKIQLRAAMAYSSKGVAKGDWVDTVDVSDVNFGMDALWIPIFGSLGHENTDAPYMFYDGIRIIITAVTTGSTGNGLGICSVQLRDTRPEMDVSDAVGCLSQLGGTVYGETTFATINTNSVYPKYTNSSSLGNSSKQWLNIFSQNIYENGTSLSNKYQSKFLDISDGLTATSGWSFVDKNLVAIRVSSSKLQYHLTAILKHTDATTSEQVAFTIGSYYRPTKDFMVFCGKFSSSSTSYSTIPTQGRYFASSGEVRVTPTISYDSYTFDFTWYGN